MYPPHPIKITSFLNKQVLARMWKKGNPHATLTGIQICVTTTENSTEVPQKIKNTTTYDQQFHFWLYVQTNPKQ